MERAVAGSCFCDSAAAVRLWLLHLSYGGTQRLVRLKGENSYLRPKLGWLSDGDWW